ncbi:MAG: DNA-binding protein [bacterium]|nr:DNA-binding protein [bacterium]
MNIVEDGYNWLIRLEKGEKVVESLIQIIRDNNIPSCWVSGIGGCLEAKVGFYDLPNQKMNWTDFKEMMEVTALQGNVSWTGTEPDLHLHVTLGKKDHTTMAGHVGELVTSGTMEIYLHRWYGPNWKKRMDPKTGIKILDI